MELNTELSVYCDIQGFSTLPYRRHLTLPSLPSKTAYLEGLEVDQYIWAIITTQQSNGSNVDEVRS